MTVDCGHNNIEYKVPEIEHYYGNKVHLLSDPHIRTLLARLCDRNTHQPLINDLVDEIYRGMLAIVIGAEFPKKTKRIETRMIQHSEHGVFRGEVVDSETPSVTVALARAGIIPSHICFNQLLRFQNPDKVRQDHLHMNRVVNDKGEVIGVDLSGSKIGGPIDGHIVVIPDPMGATASSVCHAIKHYKETVEGIPMKIITAHLIITREYIENLHSMFPDTIVYAARLDRGLSPPWVLDEPPGKHFNLERGLNDRDYIVPGAGGLGEILNNSFV
jgi:uracil phosphoribosyltransferase